MLSVLFEALDAIHIVMISMYSFFIEKQVWEKSLTVDRNAPDLFFQKNGVKK